MEKSTDEQNFVDVGVRLREMRQERNKSMRALARDSGLSTNALSMIERGLTSPSVSTLYKLADALEVPITAFFRSQQERQNIVYKKSNNRQQISFPLGLWEGLGGEAFDGRVEPFLITLEAGASSGEFGMNHSGHEFVMCIQGKIEYEVEDRAYILEPMDTLLFAAHLRHRWRNVADTPSIAVFVLSGYEKHERPSEFHQKSIDQTGSVED